MTEAAKEKARTKALVGVGEGISTAHPVYNVDGQLVGAIRVPYPPICEDCELYGSNHGGKKAIQRRG